MIEAYEQRQAVVAKDSTASELAYKTANDKFKLFHGALQGAVDKYKSTFTYRRHLKNSAVSGVDHPRVVDVEALQEILNNAQYSIALKDAMISYIDDPDHFRRSKLSPLRRYIRNAIQGYIKQHHIESLELTDTILAMYLSSGVDENKPRSDEESDTQTSDEQKEEYNALQAEFRRTKQNLVEAQQRAQQLQDEAQSNLNAKITAQRELGETIALLERAVADRQQVINEKLQLQMEKDHQAQLHLQPAQQVKDESQRMRQQLDQVQQDLAEKNSVITELRREKAETVTLLNEVKVQREQLIQENAQLQLENQQQERIIDQQSITIRALNVVIGELKASYESFKKAASDTISSFFTMFSTMKQYFKQAVLNKKPKGAVSVQHSEQSYGEEFRKQVRNELAKDAGGQIHALYQEERDPATGQAFEEIIGNFSAHQDVVDEKLEQAAQLVEQSIQSNVMVATPVKNARFDQPGSVENNNNVVDPIAAIAPPPPPPLPDARTPVKTSVAVKAKRATEGGSPAVKPVKPAPVIAKPVNMAEQAAARAKAMAAKRAAEGGSPAVKQVTPVPPTKAAAPSVEPETRVAESSSPAITPVAQDTPAPVAQAQVDTPDPLLAGLLSQVGHFQNRRHNENIDLLNRLRQIRRAASDEVSDEEWDDSNLKSNSNNK